jgi:hypothetical protein
MIKKMEIVCVLCLERINDKNESCLVVIIQ